MNQLLQLYDGAVSLPQDDQLQVIEGSFITFIFLKNKKFKKDYAGLSYVGSQLPTEQAVHAMRTLITPHAKQLSDGLNNIASAGE